MMATTDNSGPAFPYDPITHTFGMTYRQWLIGMALQGLCANPNTRGTNNQIIAVWAIQKADAILAAEEGGA